MLAAVQEVHAQAVILDEAINCNFELRDPFYDDHTRDPYCLNFLIEAVQCKFEALCGIFFDQGYSKDKSPSIIVDPAKQHEIPTKASSYKSPVNQNEVLIDCVELFHSTCDKEEI